MTDLTPSTPPPADDDRRIAQRFVPAFGTVCRLRRDQPRVGLVWNISRTGVSMLLADPPAAGTAVDAELTTEAGGHGLPVVLHVVHVRPSATGDYLLGARFDAPLDDTQLRPFVTPGPRAV